MKKYKARNNHKRQPHHQQQNFIGLDTSFLTFSQIETNKLWKRDKIWQNITTPMLLYGFFRFYAYIFPQSIYAVSIRLGKCCLLKSAFPKSKFWRMCIEDPFEAHYCHQSHDLGSHLCETGQAMISQKMRFAADTMQKIIIGNCFNNQGGEKWTMDDHSMSAIFTWDTRKNKSTGFNMNNNNNGFKGRQHTKGQKRNNSRNQERKPKNHKNLGRRNQDIRSNKDGNTNNNSNNKNNVRDTENKTNPTGKKKDTTTKVATRDQQKANTERNQTNNTKAKKK